MPHSPYDIGVAVAVKIVPEDFDASCAQVKIGMKQPFAVAFLGLFIPAFGSNDVDARIVINITMPDAVSSARWSEFTVLPLNSRLGGRQFIDEHFAAHIR